MVRHGAESGGRPASEDSVPGLQHATEPEFDAGGVPVRHRPRASMTYRLALTSLICGIVPIGLALPFLIGHKSSNLVLLGAIPAVAAAWIGLELKDRPGKRTRGIATAGAVLGMLGILLLVVASGHGIAMNDEG